MCDGVEVGTSNKQNANRNPSDIKLNQLPALFQNKCLFILNDRNEEEWFWGISSSDLIQFLPGLFLHSADVVHVQLDPFINPTEQLPVEVSEQALLLLENKREKYYVYLGRRTSK